LISTPGIGKPPALQNAWGRNQKKPERSAGVGDCFESPPKGIMK
jgi:hypothetical protein